MGTCLAKVRVYDTRQLPQHLLCACFKCHLHAHALHVTRRVGGACWLGHSCRSEDWLSKRGTSRMSIWQLLGMYGKHCAKQLLLLYCLALSGSSASS